METEQSMTDPNELARMEQGMIHHRRPRGMFEWSRYYSRLTLLPNLRARELWLSMAFYERQDALLDMARCKKKGCSCLWRHEWTKDPAYHCLV